ncbi:glycoside hydrolase family 9 protein [Micromonospora sp. NPDC005203]|uniref:glycoside hydrolase family 9 protein n=1 Tax=Micromonospora sp. NPDC005203 TaxID=3364226 RepID=UPI0036A6E135
MGVVRRRLAAIIAMTTVSTFLYALEPPTPAAAVPQDRVTASWNMQGQHQGGEERPESRWLTGVQQILNQEGVQVAALQEAGSTPPDRAVWTDRQFADAGITEHLYNIGSESRPDLVQIYWADTGQQRNGLAIVTRETVTDAVILPVHSRFNSRPMMGVQIGTDWYFTAHAQSNGPNSANDAPDIIERARQFMAGRPTGEWMVLADFNQEPARMPAALQSHLVAAGQPTHEGGSELDFAYASNGNNNTINAEVRGGNSDHRYIRYVVNAGCGSGGGLAPRTTTERDCYAPVPGATYRFFARHLEHAVIALKTNDGDDIGPHVRTPRGSLDEALQVRFSTAGGQYQLAWPQADPATERCLSWDANSRDTGSTLCSEQAEISRWQFKDGQIFTPGLGGSLQPSANTLGARLVVAQDFYQWRPEPRDGIGPRWDPIGEFRDATPAGAETHFPDLDGDGDADHVIVQPDGRIPAWRNNGPRSTWTALGDISPPDRGLPSTVHFGDLDGDDRDDYLRLQSADESPTGTRVIWMSRNESDGAQIRLAARSIVANDLRYENPRFVDIDGDGDDDLINSDRLSNASLWENRSPGRTPVPGDWHSVTGFATPADGYYQTSFTDVTGDRRADVLRVDYPSGKVQAWENTGAPWSATTGWRSLGPIRDDGPFAGTTGLFADLDADLIGDFVLVSAASGGLDGWLLPRYGSADPGPGQPGQGGGQELPAGTLPAYGGGPPRPQLDGRLLQNSTFTGTDKPWWVNAGMTPRLAGGTFCVTAPASTNPWDVLVGHNSIYLPGGATYTLRFRARTSAAANPLIYLAPFDNPTNVTYVNQGFTTGAAWKEYEYRITTTYSEPYRLAQLQFRLGKSSAPYEFCMDDVTLTGAEYAYRAEAGPEVRVNQHGYLPNGPKRATLLYGASHAVPWTLRRAGGGATVATGQSTPTGFDASASAITHVIDFSHVTATGRFELVYDGWVDKPSHPFDIRADLYDRLRTDATRFFYTNRSGTTIDGGIAGAAYARPAGHVAESPGGGDTQVPCQQPKAFLNNWTCAYRLDVTGGWYDAGDHGKYVVNGGIATYQLLSAWERNRPAALGDGTLAVPERGNGVPDILDEARWNLDFMLKMQVPDGLPLAGMVHHKVHDETWTGPPMLPHQDKKPRELHRPSTAATLNLAAVAAQAARIYQPYDAGFAARLRAAAERAYAAARANPALFAPYEDRSGGGPYNDGDVSDEFYWAASELYLTTRDAAYLSAVRVSRFHTAGTAFSQNGFYWGSVAALAQLDLARFGTGLSDREQIKGWVVAAADRLISFQRAERFGQTYTPTTGRYDWGSNASMLNNQVVLATAYDLTGNDRYADAVFEGLDYLLGRNALGQSYITGYGSNDAKNQHSRWYARSFDARLPNPPAGSVAGGPNSSLQDPLSASWLHGCAPQLCYVDNLEAWSVNEITINWNSALTWVAAFAADVAGRR